MTSATVYADMDLGSENGSWVSGSATAANIAVGSSTFKGTHDNRAYYHFNVSWMPAAATVSAGVVNLYWNGGENVTHLMHLVTSAWTEASTGTEATFSTQIASYASGASAAYVAPDIASTVDDWVSGATANYGVRVRRSVEDHSGAIAPAYSAREDSSITKDPYLTITFTLPATAATVHQYAESDTFGDRQTQNVSTGTNSTAWDQARENTGLAAQNYSSAATTMIIGQEGGGGAVYDLYEAFISYDTSFIPDGAVIVDAYLDVFINDHSVTNFVIEVRNHDWGGGNTWINGSVLAGDALVGSFDTAVMSIGSGTEYGHYQIAIDPAYISKTGVTRWVLVSNKLVDTTGRTVTGNMYVTIATQEMPGTDDPTLVMHYNSPPSTPGAFTSPLAGQVVYNGSTLHIAWGASTDPESDAITYDLDFWDGSVWQDLASPSTNSYDAGVGVPAGNFYKVRVRAIDLTGSNTYSSFVESGVFIVSDASPPPIPRRRRADMRHLITR